MWKNKYKKYIQKIKNFYLQCGGTKYKIDIDNHFSMLVDYDIIQQKYELFLLDNIDTPKIKMDGEHVAKKNIYINNPEKNSDVIWNMSVSPNGCWGLNPVYQYQISHKQIINDAFKKAEKIILEQHVNKK